MMFNSMMFNSIPFNQPRSLASTFNVS